MRAVDPLLSWRTRGYRRDDVAAVARFLAPLGDASFVSRLGDRVHAYYRWKYGDEAGECDRVRVAVGAEGVAGVVAMLPRRVRLGSRTATAFEMGDICTGSDYRRQGVFSALAREVCQAVHTRAAFTYVKPNDESAPVLSRHLGFAPLVELETLTRPLRISSILVHRFGRAALGPLSRPLDRLFAVSPGDVAVTVTRQARFTDEFDALWRAVAREYPASVVRDRAYLAWRYELNPTRYVVLAARDRRGVLRGYAVGLVVQWGDTRIGYLVDILAAASARAVRAALARAILRTCADAGAQAVHTWIVARPSPLRDTLRSLGFVIRGRSRVLWRAGGDGPPMDRTDWYFTMGDFDGI